MQRSQSNLEYTKNSIREINKKIQIKAFKLKCMSLEDSFELVFKELNSISSASNTNLNKHITAVRGYQTKNFVVKWKSDFQFVKLHRANKLIFN